MSTALWSGAMLLVPMGLIAREHSLMSGRYTLSPSGGLRTYERDPLAGRYAPNPNGG